MSNFKWLLLVAFILMQFSSIAQKKIRDYDAIELIDTLFIDADTNNWSLRLFTNYVEQRLRFTNGDHSFSLIPNNPVGIGLGVATKKLVLDVVFNIKSKEELPTQRFNMSGNIMFRNSFGSFIYQDFKGFNVVSEDLDFEYFRDDIQNRTIVLNYMHLFNTRKYSFLAMKTGLARQKKSAFSWGVGGFFINNVRSADSSVVFGPLKEVFGEEGYFKSSSGTGFGIDIGSSGFLVLPKDFFLSLDVAVGVGVAKKKIITDSQNYSPSDPFVYNLGLNGTFGYNGRVLYMNLSFVNSFYKTSLGFDNVSLFNTANMKLALGYKLGSKKK